MHQGNTTFNTQEIETHIRIYRSLLKSTGMVRISQLIDSHLNMQSILHEKGISSEVDISAFIYVLLRLPVCMSSVKNIILGQSFDVFKKHEYREIDNWQEMTTPGRRRKIFYNRRGTLAVYIASVTDVDDLITLVTAFQIEWNKLHRLLEDTKNPEEEIMKLANPDDISKIKNIWGSDFSKFMTAIKHRSVDFTIKLLSGSYVEYAKATQKWWENISQRMIRLDMEKRPVYFVSSNTHSLTNLLTGYAVEEEKALISYLYNSKDTNLIRIWKEINGSDFLANRENFLYYLAKKYARTNPAFLNRKKARERNMGVHHIFASHYLDVDAQIIEVSRLANSKLSFISQKDTARLRKSDAVIINIDYPLGWAAYQILTEIGQNVAEVRGIYIMGKAATLIGQIGDIMIPTTVFDQHTKDIYVFENIIKATDFTGLTKDSVILDNQKTVAAKGTFLQNNQLIKKWHTEGYTAIEMESGPFLNAAYEFIYYNRYMENQFISLLTAPFDIGIAHYASDTPYSKAKNLGVRNLSYEGVEPTYAIARVILKKIIEKEMSR